MRVKTIIPCLLLGASAEANLFKKNKPKHNKQDKEHKLRRASPEIYSDTVLNVHIVPHTHDDVGWLKTVDQYFYGANNTIQHAGVQYVISGMISELDKDPSRTFTYVEIAFFSRWFYEQNEEMQDIVRTLVINGQLSFANGGWCMHDEAAAHYNAMIDQTTLGHQFLIDELGFTPRVGWQIDPFGHSSTQASLLSWAAGFDALYFGRIDYQDRAIRQETQECEGLWRSSLSLGEDVQVFWSLTGQYGGNYYPPNGFNFDIEDEYVIPLMDDLNLHDYNIDPIIASFTEEALSQGLMTKGNHIMMTMGGDFQYESATNIFTNLDKVIYYGNELSGDQINVFYSTPQDFADAKNGEGIDWSVKTDDFFPYADSDHSYWTGYFTSRPLLKLYERVTSGYMQALRQLEALTRQGPMNGETSSLLVLEAAQGVTQHHDAVSGTSKQHVALDYAQRLAAGVNDASEMMTNAFSVMTGVNAQWEHCPLLNESVCSVSSATTTSDILTVAVYNPLASIRTNEFVRVPVSTSPIAVTDSDGNMLEYQVLATPWSPNTEAMPYTVFIYIDSISPLDTVLMLLSFSDNESQQATEVTQSELVTSSSNGDISSSFDVSNGYVTMTFDNSTGALTTMSFDDNGNSDTGISIDINQTFGYYIGFSAGMEGLDLGDCDPDTWEGCPDDVIRNFNKNTVKYLKERQRFSNIKQHQEDMGSFSNDLQNSGAYIFRPIEPNMDPILLGDETTGAPLTTYVSQGELVTEITQSFGPWLNQTIRLLKGSKNAEFSFSVGPVPIDDNTGKEIVSKFSTSIDNGDSQPVISTDSNGREFLKRIYNYRPTWNLSNVEPIAGNYYPVNTAAYINDNNTYQFSLIVDRSVGVASLSQGELQVMIHRRLLVDDSRGVGEPLDEYDSSNTGDYLNCKTGDGIVVVGTHLLGLNTPATAMSYVRNAMDESYAPLVISFVNIPSSTSTFETLSSFHKLKSTVDALPANVKLLTLQAVSDTSLLMRLEHEYAIGEDDVLSLPVSVNVTSFIESLGFIPSGALELTLTANQALADLNRLDWTFGSDKTVKEDKAKAHKFRAQEFTKAVGEDGDGMITLNPMEIRTAVIYV